MLNNKKSGHNKHRLYSIADTGSTVYSVYTVIQTYQKVRLSDKASEISCWASEILNLESHAGLKHTVLRNQSTKCAAV